MKIRKALALSLAVVLGLNSVVFAQGPSSPPAAQKAVAPTPEKMGVKLAHSTISTGTHADDLVIELSMVNDPKMVGKYFDRKMWRKRFVPFYLTMKNQGNYPIEVSTGNILLLEEKDRVPKKAKLSQVSSTKPSSKQKKRARKDLPPFVSPTPPGIVFNKSKHVQYGWKSNLGMLALTGATLGFAAPLTVPAMVVGNMHRGTNKRMAQNFQDQALARITIEPGEEKSTWLFYRRNRKKQALIPRKVVFADIYTPSQEELSSFVLDLQPLAAENQAVRRAMEDSEVKDLHLFQGKIVAETKHEQSTEKMKDLESLGSDGSEKSPPEEKP